MRVFISQIDAFNPERAEAENIKYAGELSLCAVKSGNIREAVEKILVSIESEGVDIKTIDFCGPAADYQGDPSLFNVTLGDLEQAAATSGEVVFSDVVTYETE